MEMAATGREWLWFNNPMCLGIVKLIKVAAVVVELAADRGDFRTANIGTLPLQYKNINSNMCDEHWWTKVCACASRCLAVRLKWTTVSRDFDNLFVCNSIHSVLFRSDSVSGVPHMDVPLPANFVWRCIKSMWSTNTFLSTSVQESAWQSSHI